MPDTKYDIAIKRYAYILGGAIGVIAFLTLAGLALAYGRTFGGFSTVVYTQAHNPSQFWFDVVFYALLGVGSIWFVWKAYCD